MSSAAWWAQRLAREQGQQPPQYVPSQQYVPPQQYQPPPQYPQAPQHYPQQQPNVNPQALSEQQIIAGVKAGTIDPMSVLAMVGAKGGGKGSKVERDLCPECGSNHYFQRKGASKMGMAPAPYCHSCGYNGLYEQYGTMDVPITEGGA